MSLRDHAAPTGHIGSNCATCGLLATMPADEADALTEMLGNPKWSAPAIVAALKAEGYNTPVDTAVRRHINGQCAQGVKYR